MRKEKARENVEPYVLCTVGFALNEHINHRVRGLDK